MKRKLKSDRGFTLAELLIVVAIIGVLVAIAIPIFTSQLERSREAVDLSDVRSAYAEVMMAAITGGYQCYVYERQRTENIQRNGWYLFYYGNASKATER
ncbi:MAG: pilin [Ruminococcus sp.]